MNLYYPAWFCEHRDTIAVGDKLAQWKAYCEYNRRCRVADDGCHEMTVTREFIAQYQGPIAGTLDHRRSANEQQAVDEGWDHS